MGIPAVYQRRLRQLLAFAAPYGGVALFVLGLTRSGISESLDLLLYDTIVAQKPAPSGDTLPIVIVGIDEADIAHYGWPVDDGVLCRAIERAAAAGATAIVSTSTAIRAWEIAAIACGNWCSGNHG